MALGVNIQWGYAMRAVQCRDDGLRRARRARGGAGLAAAGARGRRGGRADLLLAAGAACLTAGLVWLVVRKVPRGRLRSACVAVTAVAGYFVIAAFFDPAIEAIEAVDRSTSGYLGGLGLPIVLSWAAGGLFAAGAAWVIGRVALGLRADYFAIATLGISEIVIAVLKNEDWLARGVKNVTGLDRPVPYEIDLQQAGWFADMVGSLNAGALAAASEADRALLLRDLVIEASGIFVKLCYAGCSPPSCWPCWCSANARCARPGGA